MKYGLPYKGSKNRLAERIVSLLPEGRHLIDMFCGGCAVTHYALLCGKYGHIHINDIDWRPVTLFEDALAGKYSDERRWISRDDFFRLKDTDPYVAIVWSFGNNMRDYLYSREIEQLKRALHYAIFYGDYAPGVVLGHDLSFLEGVDGVTERYLAVKRYFVQNRAGELASLERGGYYSDLEEQTPRGTATPGSLRTAVRFKKKEQRLQHIERCALLQTATQGTSPLHARMGGGKNGLTSSVGDYRDVEIPDGSVIYCDIPYKGTDVYDKATAFDYEAFYDWCSRQTQPLFVSSYDMPADRFVCIREFAHRSTLSAQANNAVIERIFIPRHQRPPKEWVQLELFT